MPSSRTSLPLSGLRRSEAELSFFGGVIGRIVNEVLFLRKLKLRVGVVILCPNEYKKF